MPVTSYHTLNAKLPPAVPPARVRGAALPTLLATLAFALLIGCSTPSETAQTERRRTNSAEASYPLPPGYVGRISLDPEGAAPYSDHWKLKWADSLLFEFAPFEWSMLSSDLSPFEAFATRETGELLLDAALGVSCTPPTERMRYDRGVAETLAEVSLAYPDLLERFAESSRDSMMVLWAVAEVSDQRDDLAGSNLLERCLGCAGQSDLHDQWVARILYRVYRDKVPAEVYRTTSDGVRKYYETGRYH